MTDATQGRDDLSFDVEVPDGWVVAGSSARGGSTLTITAPADHGHVSTLTFDVYERNPDTASDAIPRLHRARVLELLDAMTDARLLDGIAESHDGREGYRATVVYRHGPYLVTAFVWTLAAPFGALAILGLTDSDRLGVDATIFDAVLQSLRFASSGDQV